MIDDGHTPCPVCQGSKRICLPLRHQLTTADFDPEAAMRPVESSREYDCPECGPTRIKVEKFSAMKVLSLAEMDQMSEATKTWWRENVSKHMGRMIAERLIDDGMIEFTKLEPDAYHPEGMQARIYVATPKHWEPIEERIAARQMDVADEVATEAKRLIDNWGSYFGHAEILKCDARREIDDAIRHIKAARAKK